ncbi:MAG: hypothetical protein NC115_06330 [Bacteroidales bacterium]|nr:hypothetical protein [Bacteroidales bacterium]
MKKIQSLYWTGILAAVMAAGCDPVENTIGGGITVPDDVTFAVSASDVTTDMARITISHDGTSANTFCGFCYDDIETSVDMAINRRVAEMSQSGNELADFLIGGTSYRYILKNLESRKTYRYVVFGLNADGTVYGTPGQCEFSTERVSAEFSVNVSNVGTETASASVSSTGYDDDTWYAFCTEDLDSDLSDVIAAEIAVLGERIASSLKSGNAEVEFTGLRQDTGYRVVVTGLLADGTVYGTAVSASFKTEREPVVYRVNEAWTVTYAGRADYEGELSDFISVTSTSSADRYVIGVYSAETVSKFGIEAVCEDVAAGIVELVEQFVGQGLPRDLVMSVFTHTESADEPYNLFDPGEYIAVAAGIDDDLNVTGLYALSDAFVIEEAEEEDATEGYKAWLGTWNITDAKDSQNNHSVTIAADEVNKSYVVTDFISEKCTYKAEFDASTNELVFKTYDEPHRWNFTDFYGNIKYLGLIQVGADSQFVGGSMRWQGQRWTAMWQQSRYAAKLLSKITAHMI